MSPHLSPCLCVVLEDMACPPDDQQTAMSSVTVNTTDYSQCDYIHEERIRQVQIKKAQHQTHSDCKHVSSRIKSILNT